MEENETGAPTPEPAEENAVDDETLNQPEKESDQAEGQAKRSRGWRPVLLAAGAVIILVAACAAVAFLFLRSDDEAEATPEAARDAYWTGIQGRGRFIAGTAADYPPFEYYNNEFQLDGLDIAIANEIGRRLNLQVVMKDIAFDGLGNALLVNQIDMAISAISVTEDRAQVIDFSNIYYVSEDAVVAAPESAVTGIDDLEEIGSYKLGVESGTVYDTWAQDNLVETGLMPAENLFRYQRLDDAYLDLAEGRIDLITLDVEPARVAENNGAAKIIGGGLNSQRLAIAVPKGASTWLARVNEALANMQADGTLSALITQYVGLAEGEIRPLPTPPDPETEATPVPPAPTPECIDSAAYVADLSFDDQVLTNFPELSPGQSFEKGWRLQNTGTCEWNSDIALIPVSGNDPAARMGGLPIVVDGTVPPGETYDFFVDLVAPVEAGTYIQYWSMRNNRSGLLFGERVSVAIEVLAQATPTPPPTQTPAPGIAFAANPEVIQQGQCSSLTWNTQNVQAVYLYEQGENWQDNGVSGSGTRTVCPLTTTTYELRVVKTDGVAEIRTVTVYVLPNSQVPQIERFTVDPPDLVAAGQCVTVQWAVSGQVNTVTIWRNQVAIRTNAPISGAIQDCPIGVGQQVYTLEATGPGGTAQANWIISVVDSSTPVPTSTPTVAPLTPTPATEPIIYYFTTQPELIHTNQCVTLSWSVGGNASLINIIKNNQILQENVAFRGSWSDCAQANAGTIIYELLATSRINQSVNQVVSVNVLP